MASLQEYVASEWERAWADAQGGKTRFLIFNGAVPDPSALSLDAFRAQAGANGHIVFSQGAPWKAYGPFLEWLRHLWLSRPLALRQELRRARQPIPVVETVVFSFLEKGYPDEPEPFPPYPAEVDFYTGAFDNLLLGLWNDLLCGGEPHVLFLDNLQEAPESVIRFLTAWISGNSGGGPGILVSGTWVKPSLPCGPWKDFFKVVEQVGLQLPQQPVQNAVMAFSPSSPPGPREHFRDARFSFRFLALAEARRDAEEGVDHQTGSDGTETESSYLMLLGDIFSAGQENDAALLALNQALQGALQFGDLERIGLIYLKQAFVYMKMDDWDEARLLVNKATKLLVGRDEKLRALADFHRLLLGQKGATIVAEVRELAERLERRRWLNLASHLRLHPFYLLALAETSGSKSALGECSKVRRFCQRTGHQYRLSTVEHAMGLIHQEAGDDRKALKHYRRSMAIREKLGNKLEMIKVFNGTGYFSFTRGRYREALRLFEKCLRLLEEVRDFQELALTLFNVGSVYLVVGRANAAFEAFEAVIRIMDELHLPSMPFHERWEVYTLGALSAYLSGNSEGGKDLQNLVAVSQAPEGHVLVTLLDYLSRGSLVTAHEWEGLLEDLQREKNMPMETLVDQVRAWVLPGSKRPEGPRLPRLVFHVESILECARQVASLNKLHKKIHEIQFLSNLQSLIVRTQTWQDLVRDSMKLIKNSFLATYLFLVMVNQKNQRELVFSHPDPDISRVDFWKDLGQWTETRAEVLAHPRDLPHEIGSLLTLPLSEGNEFFGTLMLATSEKEPQLGPDDLKTLSIAVKQIAMAVELKRANEKLVRAATVDSLTGLLNRQEVYKMMVNERKRVLRYKEKAYGPFSLLFIDLDNFKFYNDSFGHALGDRMLQLFAELLRKGLRDVDITGRFGGDEFLVILPETNLAGARKAAERLNAELESRRNFQDEMNAFLRRRITLTSENLLTCSVGITEFSSSRDMDIEELVALADNALYEAKRSGKNRIVLISGEPSVKKPI